jgi:hypothetical protein
MQKHPQSSLCHIRERHRFWGLGLEQMWGAIIQLTTCLLPFFFVELGFELRASYLQSRHSTTWATPPIHFCSGYFGERVLWSWTEILLISASQDYKCDWHLAGHLRKHPPTQVLHSFSLHVWGEFIEARSMAFSTLISLILKKICVLIMDFPIKKTKN